MAINGDPKARQMYEFVYGDAAEGWNGIVALHEKAIKNRIGEIVRRYLYNSTYTRGS